MKKFLLVLASLMLIPQTVIAQGLEGENVFVSNGDIYSVDDEVRVLDDVSGDLFLIGNDIIIRGNVEEDLFVIANKIRIEGNVGGDARMLGNEVTILGSIDEDLMLTASKISLGKDSRIGGNGYILGESLSFEGVIEGDLSFEGSKLSLYGEVDKDVVAGVATLWVANDARIGGDLRYSAGSEFNISSGVVEGKVFFQERESVSGWEWFLLKISWKAFSLVNSLVLAALLVFLVPKVLIKKGKKATEKPGSTLGLGLFITLGLMSIPIMIVGTYVGIKLAIIMMLLAVILLLLGSTFGAIWMAVGLLKNEERYNKKWILFGVTAGVSAALSLLSIIPYVGFLVPILVTLFGIGGFVRMDISKLDNKKPSLK